MSPWQPLPGDVPEPRPVSDSLSRLARSLGAPAPTLLTAIFARWEEIVGPAIADHAWPLSIRAGVLRLGVDEPAWATQIGFLGADLVRKVAAATGEETIVGVEVKVVPRRGK